jgi:hypothetical protein
MLIMKGVVAAAALAHTASASFFWFPDWRCVEDKTCIASKRSMEAGIEGRDVEARLEIAQRLPQVIPPTDLSQRVVLTLF